MLDKMSDASRIVERLVQKDLVKRCVSNKDRRAVDILISQKGLEILQKLDNEISLKDMLSNSLSEEEAIALSGLLDKMRG
jgi:DNA-binding MarR family transcriptional regulator